MRRVIPASVALILHRERALVLRRPPDERSFPNRWCLPGGRIDAGESPTDAAIRETLEETGLALVIVASLGPQQVAVAHLPVDFEIHRFVGTTDRDAVVLSTEHVDFRWIARAEATRAATLLPSGLAGEVTTDLLARFADGAL